MSDSIQFNHHKRQICSKRGFDLYAQEARRLSRVDAAQDRQALQLAASSLPEKLTTPAEPSIPKQVGPPSTPCVCPRKGASRASVNTRAESEDDRSSPVSTDSRPDRRLSGLKEARGVP
ncbi:hypothetical protein NPX13_g8968 [Xylaria arbuscula]|uniref:Uncharacterized protein n=1 Tax=Xylaria arbuscula TaxID=114810 RepID=A0A9W8N7A0_9PEZI|nr:hypothetical protein NPX13_g8968 [Xylaria arbuscula]